MNERLAYGYREAYHVQYARAERLLAAVRQARAYFTTEERDSDLLGIPLTDEQRDIIRILDQVLIQADN
jgi:hypothetical protein